MLVELNISNFAIIDSLSLRFSPGFNTLTGETGAGKSIIIDAVGAILGAKTGAEFIRHGQNQARVEGYYELAMSDKMLEDERFRHLLELLQRENLLEDENYAHQTLRLNLSREVNLSGRSVCRINGSSVRQDILREVGEALVDIHGQTEHISLLRVSEHLELLDQYAGVIQRRIRLSDLVGQLRMVRRDINGMQRDEREMARRVDLLKFQLEEIDAARLQPGEEEEMLKQRQILNSAEKLTAVSDRAYKLLYEGFEEGGEEGGYGKRGRGSGMAVHAALAEIERLLSDLLKFEAEIGKHLETVQEAAIKLEDVAHALRDFRDRVEYDPKRLEGIEERLEMIRSLKRKYGNGIPEILVYRQKAATELEQIVHSDERLAELHAQEQDLLQQIGVLAGEISKARRSAADKLAQEVEQSLRDLKLLRARFEVNITQREDFSGAPVTLLDGRKGLFAFDGHGVDRVEFYVSLNPGEPPKPLQKVASGGETSRLMLALKSILASADSVPTLIFDEVDVGVGGRSGQVVGEKLWQLTNSNNHQVICITHLPQIAAFGDSHFNIMKKVVDDRTLTTVRQLDYEAIIEELAAMLGGLPVSDSMRNSAVEMLKDVKGWKEAVHNGTLEQFLAQRHSNQATGQGQLWEELKTT
ncbi:MAG: DNA repair protein RecN [Chloroflexi bacterium]|uniref:DNA repair protein RecN n=1 Tax=Candidatus Chlorohelix allophototropha TaxID=3003348 RepID=A0A8T7M1M8_9CHLR|nr:DNA repair protein RecN [Chloroflexota bacterium]WJW67831.1 DNA repair protein RecN [Chloroflexota bacterium L227-S17]